MDILADTSFLIDLWRESGSPGPATQFAGQNATRQVGICWVVQGEFLSGAVLAAHDVKLAAAFLSRYPIVHSTDAIVDRYARLFAELRRANRLVGPNDLWIAATALALDLPLLTRNTDEFARVSDLRMVAYA